jgi:S1-C subfamily serine protease
MKSFVVVMAFLAMTVPALAQDNGWIGVSIAEQPDRGVLVRRVESNSPAERAGLKANDVIVQFNRQDVLGVLQLTRLVNETPAGRSVDIVIRRDNLEQTLRVTSERAPLSTGRVHVEGPDFSNFADQLHKSFATFEVKTSTSMTQAGITADSLTPQLREFFGVRVGEGVLVASVDANSAAARAGVLAGDVITAIDGRTISSPAGFYARSEVQNQQGFLLKVVRNKQEREIRLERGF